LQDSDLTALFQNSAPSYFPKSSHAIFRNRFILFTIYAAHPGIDYSLRDRVLFSFQHSQGPPPLADLSGSTKNAYSKTHLCSLMITNIFFGEPLAAIRAPAALPPSCGSRTDAPMPREAWMPEARPPLLILLSYGNLMVPHFHPG